MLKQEREAIESERAQRRDERLLNRVLAAETWLDAYLIYQGTGQSDWPVLKHLVFFLTTRGNPAGAAPMELEVYDRLRQRWGWS